MLVARQGMFLNSVARHHINLIIENSTNSILGVCLLWVGTVKALLGPFHMLVARHRMSF